MIKPLVQRSEPKVTVYDYTRTLGWYVSITSFYIPNDDIAARWLTSAPTEQIHFMEGSTNTRYWLAGAVVQQTTDGKHELAHANILKHYNHETASEIMVDANKLAAYLNR